MKFLFFKIDMSKCVITTAFSVADGYQVNGWDI